MNLFDPSRPRINAFPAYCWEGRPVGPIPALLTRPLTPSTLRLSGWFLTQPNLAFEFGQTFDTSELPAILAAWIEDPERQMLSWGWTFSERRANLGSGSGVKSGRVLRMDDLDEIV